jgi:hypothetical protein
MKNIAIHETNVSQFCDPENPSRTSGSSWCAGGARPGEPIYGVPGGYGIFQLDPPVALSQIWDWRSNVDYAKTLLDAKAGPPVDNAQNQGDPRAYPFWIRQVRQWRTENPSAGFFQDAVETASCRFTLSPSPIPTPAAPQWTTPNTGQSGVYWFGDAILMKQYGGAASDGANYVSWVNRDLLPGQQPYWSSRRGSEIVVQGQIQTHNWTYEFCTCAVQGAACQHSTPAANLTPLPLQ